MGISILVDDMRYIQADHVFRDFRCAVDFLKKNESVEIDLLYLDYYLDDRGLLTGYDFAMEIFYRGIFPKVIKVVSSSDDGCEKLEGLITRFNYIEKYKNEYHLIAETKKWALTINMKNQ